MIDQENLVELFARVGTAAQNVFVQALGRAVRISAPQVAVVDKAEVGMLAEGQSAIACTPIESPRPGIILLVLTPPLDTLLPELIVNPNAIAPPQRFTDLHKGALAELMSRFWAAASSVFTGRTGAPLRTQQPEIIRHNLADCLNAMPLFTGIDQFAVVIYDIKITDAAASRMILVMPAQFLKELISPTPAAKASPAPKQPLPMQEIQLEHIETAEPDSSPVHHEKKARREKGPHDNTRNLQTLLDIPMQVIVELGKAEMDVDDILALGPGSVVELDQAAGRPVNVLVNGKLIARGDVVTTPGENFGLRITQIITPSERL